MEAERWENDENIVLQLDQPQTQGRVRTLVQASRTRIPLMDVTHLFPSDVLSSPKFDTSRRRAAVQERSSRLPAYPFPKKRRPSMPETVAADRQAALLRKFR